MVTHTHDTSERIRREDISMSDRDILSRYIGITRLPCKIQSPLRENDRNPSFLMNEKNDKVYWYDFGLGEGGSLFDLLCRLWNVDYKEAVLKIYLDTASRIPRFSLIRKYKGKVSIVSDSTIKVRTREWKDWDIEFWNSFGISKKFCEWANVHPVSHAFFTKKDPDTGKEYTVTVPMDKYAYAYFEWKDGKESIKLYQPYSQTMKWLSKHDSSVWDLWKQAFKWADTRSDEAVIITSSRKDAMCLWENLGIPAMSLQGEGYLPKPQVMQQVLDRFKNVYIWYDNDFTHEHDNPGQDNAKKLIELYPKLQNIVIPSEYECKDPSDLVKKLGVSALANVWGNQK